ncbi:uncharacterized protein [Antedon mediterranea]|uniref:uncharacterized protein n=1 Tax=Antedon mediterranea TaxID=105859 RepID=UPI003AF5162C
MLATYGVYTVDEMDNIAWSKRAYTLNELLNSYKFPLIVQVVRGHYGSEDTDSLGMGQIVRIHRKQTQKRVIAVEERRGRRISIPRDYSIPFELVPVRRETRPRTLDEILCDHVLPVKVQFSRHMKLEYHVDNQVMIDEDFGTMVIEEIYDEPYLQGNAINFSVLDNDIIDITAYLRLEFTIAEGLLGDDTRNLFKTMCDDLDSVVEEKIDYNQDTGNQHIAVYYQRKDTKNFNVRSTIPDRTLTIHVCDPNSVETFADVHSPEIRREIPHLETIIDGTWSQNHGNDEFKFREYIPKHFTSPRPSYMQDNIVFMSESKLQSGNFESKPWNGSSGSASVVSTTSSASSVASTSNIDKVSYKKSGKRNSIPSSFRAHCKEDVAEDVDSPSLGNINTDFERQMEDDKYPGLFRSSNLMKVSTGAFRVDTRSKERNEGVFTPGIEYDVNEKGKKVKIKKKKDKIKKDKKEKRISKIQDIPRSLEALNVNQVIDMLTLIKLGSYSPTVAIEGIDGAKLKTMKVAEYETKLGMSPQDANRLATFCLNTF